MNNERNIELMNYPCKYDITGFANDLGISFTEIAELYAELINEINSALSELKILIHKKDLLEIQKIIHNLKGVCGNYRLTDIYEETCKINDSLKLSYYNTLESDLSNLFITINIAEKEIKNFFSQNSVFI